jgi:TatD DNase family protein
LQQEALEHRLDAHLHLQTIPWNSGYAETPGRDIIKSFFKTESKSICNGTSPLDWDRSSSAKGSFNQQVVVFKEQLNLALSLDLPVALHCVRAWGILLEILQEKIQINIGTEKYCRIPVMIHSFSGSIEIMRQLTDMGVFISFSPNLVSVRAESLRGVLKDVPLERILIESDFSYTKNIPINNQISEYNRNINSLYSIAGSLKDIDPLYFQEVVYTNGKIFTDRALNRSWIYKTCRF